MENEGSNMAAESSNSGFTDAVGVDDAKGPGQGEDEASSDLESGESNNLEVIYDSWHMLHEIMWATTLSNISFQVKTMWSCFQLCYLFPRDYDFYKDDIIQLWIAQGFIVLSPDADDNSAYMYFKAFQEMSIFQFSCLDYSDGGPKYRLNHSIVYLIEARMDDKFCRVDVADFSVSDNTMHSSVGCSLQSESFNRFCKATKLCTLMILNEHGSDIEHVPRNLFLKLHYLRVLDFSHTSITELPSSVRNLKELRYLNLSKTLIETLPKSICDLHQMQTLKLKACPRLEDLPKGMKKLRNLRYLEVDVACLLVSMPPGFGDLIELRRLPAFVVGKENGYHVNELKHMVNLHGALQILRLENVSSSEEAKGACLNSKIHLKKLEFQWTKLQDGHDILLNLEPHTNLKELQILGYGDVKFPRWIGSPIFSKLVTVSIHDCPKCDLLPPLGTLPFLKDMSISEMHELKTIDHQFCGRYMELSRGSESASPATVSGNVSDADMPNAFPNLESFTLNRMPKLDRWIGIAEGDFPKLKKLHILDCWMLKALPQFPLSNSLHRLEIRLCPLLEDIQNGGLLNSLEHLIIIDCPLVKEQFQKDQEQEWSNLEHISNVWIDYLPLARIRQLKVLDEEEKANGKGEEIPTPEIELVEFVLDQMPENESVQQLETEAAQHSITKSAQVPKLQSVDFSQNMPVPSSHERKLIPPIPVLLDQTLNKYEVSKMTGQWQKGKLIGHGTFGSVYVAFNRETGALCAMKEVDLIPDDPKFTKCMQQLEQEIKVFSELKHPNIVQYYGSEIVGNHFYIYLEYVPLGSVKKYVREYCGAITESVVRSFTRHILHGLAYLHGTKTVHGDIKGDNLLVDASGVVKLADFGMAKHLSGQVAGLSFKGSPYWMAPEIIHSAGQKDSNPKFAFAADIWSLGCTIIEIVNEKHPWSEFEGFAVLFKASKETPPIPEALSPIGKDFLQCCFRRNPAERPLASMLLEHPFVNHSLQTDIQASMRSFSAMKLGDTMQRPSEVTTHKVETMSVSPQTLISEEKLPV